MLQSHFHGSRCFYLTLTFLLSLLIGSSAQGNVTFRKTFGDTRYDSGSAVQQTTDGGYILFGLTTNDSSYNYDLYLIKTDYQGEKEWERKYGDQSFQFGNSVQQVTDGGYILCGADDGIGQDSMTLIRTDASGHLLWQKKYRMSAHRSNGRFVRQTTDGGFVATGYSGDSFVEDVYIIKTDANGTLEWSKTYGGPGRDYGVCIQQTPDNGYIVLGETNSHGYGGVDMYVLRMNSVGDTLWTRTYGTQDHESGFSLDLTDDGGFIGLGTNSNRVSDLYMVKADHFGNELWSKEYGGESQDAGYDVQQTTDGGYFLAGRKHQGSNLPADMYAVKTDHMGEVLWENVYPEGRISEAYSAQQTSDGGYIMLGTATYEVGQGFSSDMYLVKIDADGNTSGTIDPENKVAFSICPNPVFQTARIKFEEPIEGTYTLFLYDTNGRAVREETGLLFQEIVFDRRDLTAGIYFFRLLSGDKELGKGKIIVL